MTKIHEHVEKISFSLLPVDHEDRFPFSTRIEYRGNGNYAVIWLSLCLSTKNEWVIDTASHIESDAEFQQYIKDHRYKYEEAVAKAKEACQSLVVNRISIQEVLEQHAASHH
jgi:hypothetical protein